MYVTPKQFDWQIGWLKRRGYQFLTFTDLVAAAEPDPTDANPTAAAAVSRAKRQVVITLDDGYENNYRQAFPILKKHGVRAVIYPIRNDLGRRDVSWPGATEQTPADMMTEAQLQEMAAAGIEFGSHLLHHQRLTEMSADQQRQELAQSKQDLEALQGAPVLSIAYPYGAYDEEVLERTRAAGYQFGVTTEPGVNSSATDPLRLNRYTAKGCKFYHPLKFRRMIAAAEREADRQ